MIRVPKPLGGLDLKREIVTQVILWSLFAKDDPVAKERGFVDVDQEQLEIAQGMADDILSALSEFSED
jgi:hypothetical protein